MEDLLSEEEVGNVYTYYIILYIFIRSLHCNCVVLLGMIINFTSNAEYNPLILYCCKLVYCPVKL